MLERFQGEGSREGGVERRRPLTLGFFLQAGHLHAVALRLDPEHDAPIQLPRRLWAVPVLDESRSVAARV